LFVYLPAGKLKEGLKLFQLSPICFVLFFYVVFLAPLRARLQRRPAAACIAPTAIYGGFIYLYIYIYVI